MTTHAGSHRLRRGGFGRSLSLLVALLLGATAQAQFVPPPLAVPGKEYSDHLDINASHLPDPEQTLLWDGSGRVQNGFKYGNTAEVDGMANVNDFLFHEVNHNAASLLFSTTGDHPAPILYLSPNGSHGIWATAPEINSQGVADLDGLEVWGPEGVPDANRYSLAGDPDGIAVFANDLAPGRSSVFTVPELASAIGLDRSLWGAFDLDGLMTWGDTEILFSIEPIATPNGILFDGGEVWHWARGAGNANFLELGGYTFNTELEIREVFGTRSENIDALEAVARRAVPEPSTYGLIAAMALIVLAAHRRRSAPRQ